MTIETARALKPGDMVHSTIKKNADGSPMRAMVTSVKTWKDGRIEVRVKHGLYDYARFSADELALIDPGRE